MIVVVDLLGSDTYSLSCFPGLSHVSSVGDPEAPLELCSYYLFEMVSEFKDPMTDLTDRMNDLTEGR